MKFSVLFATFCLLFNLTWSQIQRRCQLQVYSEGLQCKCCNINSFLCYNHCCPVGYQCRKGNRPWCEGSGYSKENKKDWVRAVDKESARIDECDNDEAKRHQYLEGRRLTAFYTGRSGL